MKSACHHFLRAVFLAVCVHFCASGAPLPPGTLDPTFNRFGMSFGVPKTGRAVALQPDGRIVVLGSMGIHSNQFGVVRFLGDGTLDGSFGAGGVVTASFNGSEVQEARGVAVQPDGKVIAVGWARQTLIDGSVFGASCARFNLDGSPDTSFGTGGVVFLRPDSRNCYGQAVVLRPDGRILIGGKVDRAAGTGLDFLVIQLNSNGSLDGQFGGGAGWLATDFSAGNDEVTALALLGDGRIHVAGTAFTVGTYNFATARYAANGTLEGVASYDFPPNRVDRANALALYSDGRALLVGSVQAGNLRYQYGAVRLATDLNPDPSFGAAGKLMLSLFPAPANGLPPIEEAYATAIQMDGRILVAGHANCCGLGLVRLNADGSVDDSFGTSGQVNYAADATFADAPRAMVLDGDGRIITAGDSSPNGITMRFLGGVYPFHGVPSLVPGRIEAEDYDNGGPEQAYHDVTPSRNESTPPDQSNYRPGSGVDLERNHDLATNVHLAYVQAGEWTQYTVQAPAALESWSLRARVAASLLGGTFRVLVDGGDATGPVQIPNTGGWLSFQTVEVPGRFAIAAGRHVLRIEFLSAGANGTFVGNLNWFEIVPAAGCSNWVSSGLVGWWPGEGGADRSGLGNSATPMNGVALAPGLVGQAFSLDGVDDYLQVPNSPSLNPATNLTLEAWIQTSATPDYSRVISKFYDVGMGGANQGYGLGMHAGGTMRADIGNGRGGYYTVFHPRLVTDGLWHHVVAVFTPSLGALYVDGVPGPAAALAGIAPVSTQPLLLGVDPCCSGRSFHGLIDEAAVYNRALSASEIQDIYVAGAAGRCGVTTPGPRNLPPVVADPIPHQFVRPAQIFNYTIPADTFLDPDLDQTLSYRVENLPADFTFDPATRSFGGLPASFGLFAVRVIATDNGIPALSATNEFLLDVVNASFLVINADDSGPGSLRQAILDANRPTAPLPSIIAFDIQPPGPKTIRLLSNLPTMMRRIVVDATTQPGFNGQPIIELDGTNITVNSFGFDVQGSDCLIRGFVIHDFQYGVQFRGLRNHLEGCYLGTDLSGREIRRNNVASVSLTGSSHVIGGTNAAARNVISGSTSHGLVINSGVSNVIQGNFIGTDVSGTNSLGNAGSGIFIMNLGLGRHRIGGNVIAFNGFDGVRVQGTNTTIIGNSIFQNGALGIGYRDDGLPSTNDLADVRWPVNSPEITAATMLPAGVALDGMLRSHPSRVYRLDFYSNPERDPSGYGEGKTWLGAMSVTTDVFGNVPFHVVLPPVQGQPFLTATTTDEFGGTSEFAACLLGQDMNVPLVARVTRAPGGAATVRLTWVDPANAYALETAPSFQAPVTWQAVTDGVTRTPGLNSCTMTLPAGEAIGFYRLRR